MRKKIMLVFLFIVFLSLGLFLIDTALYSSTEWCRCASDITVRNECDATCAFHGGCLYYSIDWAGCHCVGWGSVPKECQCQWRIECLDGATGWTYTVENCIDCWFSH